MTIDEMRRELQRRQKNCSIVIVKLGRSIKYLVPEVVEEYILKERLYK